MNEIKRMKNKIKLFGLMLLILTVFACKQSEQIEQIVMESSHL
jgi:CMP-N-acetylneuraminic acid synthetase